MSEQNKTKHYETMFIVKPTLVEDEIKQKIDFYKDAITKNGGKIETCLDMGMRNLAYDIKKHKRGYYFVIYFIASPKAILELERLYRINEDILRFIVIKYESKKEQKAWQTLIDRANKKVEPIKLSPPRTREDRGYDRGKNRVEASTLENTQDSAEISDTSGVDSNTKNAESKNPSDSADS